MGKWENQFVGEMCWLNFNVCTYYRESVFRRHRTAERIASDAPTNTNSTNNTGKIQEKQSTNCINESNPRDYAETRRTRWLPSEIRKRILRSQQLAPLFVRDDWTAEHCPLRQDSEEDSSFAVLSSFLDLLLLQTKSFDGLYSACAHPSHRDLYFATLQKDNDMKPDFLTFDSSPSTRF